MENIHLGLKENWQQFSLLVLVNAFVGGMVGLERSILPAIAEQDFGLAASWAGIRTLRLADGPDEVHRGLIAKLELRPYLS